MVGFRLRMAEHGQLGAGHVAKGGQNGSKLHDLGEEHGSNSEELKDAWRGREVWSREEQTGSDTTAGLRNILLIGCDQSLQIMMPQDTQVPITLRCMVLYSRQSNETLAALELVRGRSRCRIDRRDRRGR